MPLTTEQVIGIAELAKLDLTKEEIETYTHQLSAVLDYAARLDQLDTSNIPPTASVLPLHSVLREDVARPSLPRPQALANAHDSTDGQFRVDAVLD